MTLDTISNTAQETANSAEDRTKRNAYTRQWRKRHPEKVARTMAKYWTRKAAEYDAANEADKEGSKTNGKKEK